MNTCQWISYKLQMWEPIFRWPTCIVLVVNGRTLLSDQPDSNTSYLFNKKAFFMAIPGGPSHTPFVVLFVLSRLTIISRTSTSALTIN